MNILLNYANKRTIKKDAYINNTGCNCGKPKNTPTSTSTLIPTPDKRYQEHLKNVKNIFPTLIK